MNGRIVRVDTLIGGETIFRLPAIDGIERTGPTTANVMLRNGFTHYLSVESEQDMDKFIDDCLRTD